VNNTAFFPYTNKTKMARKLKYNDEEGGMAKAQLQKIEMYAAKLNEMIHPEDELEGWVQNKLSVVAAYMGDVKHYLDYALQNEPEYKEFANGGMMDKPRYWEVEFTWDAADEESRKVNVMAESVSDAEEQVKKKFGPYYEGLKVVEVEEDKEITWDEYEKRPKKYETRSYSKEEMDEITRAQIKHDEEQLRREQGFADGGTNDGGVSNKELLERIEEVKKAAKDISKKNRLRTYVFDYEFDNYTGKPNRLSERITWGYDDDFEYTKDKGFDKDIKVISVYENGENKKFSDGGMMAKGGIVFDPKEVREFEKYVFSYYGKNGMYADLMDEGVPATTGEVLKAVSQYLAYLSSPKKSLDISWGNGDSVDRELVRDIMIHNRNPKRNLEHYLLIKDMKKTPVLEYGGILQPMIGGVNADPRFDIYNTTMFAKRGAELPKGYRKGGFVTTIDDVIASADLISEAESKMGEDKMVLNFAYTDYGGDFFDKVAIKFFEENYPDNIVVENTMYSGQNAIVFGEPAREFAEASEKYLLGFDNIEDYYYEMQYEQEREDFERFLEDTEKYDNYKVKPEAINWLMENKSGYYSILPSGLDYSSSDLQEELEKEGLIEKDEYAKGGETKIYEVATKTKGKSGQFASSIRAKSKEDALRIFKEKHGDDKNKVIVDVYETSRKRLEHGGKTHEQGYDDREDESLAMRHGKIASKHFVGSHHRREHSRRDDARFETRKK